MIDIFTCVLSIFSQRALRQHRGHKDRDVDDENNLYVGQCHCQRLGLCVLRAALVFFVMKNRVAFCFSEKFGVITSIYITPLVGLSHFSIHPKSRIPPHPFFFISPKSAFAFSFPGFSFKAIRQFSSAALSCPSTN